MKINSRIFLTALFVVIIMLAGLSACGKKPLPPDEPILEVSITISDKSLRLEEWDTYTLTAEAVNYSGSIVWSSKNSLVASVENGEVSALAAGSTEIMASAGDKKVVCTVTVTASTYYPQLAVKNKDLTIIKGSAVLLNAGIRFKTIPVNADMSFESLNKSVATVDSQGVVTAVDVGTAIIEINAEYRGCKLSDRVFVTVENIVKPEYNPVFAAGGIEAVDLDLGQPLVVGVSIWSTDTIAAVKIDDADVDYIYQNGVLNIAANAMAAVGEGSHTLKILTARDGESQIDFDITSRVYRLPQNTLMDFAEDGDILKVNKGTYAAQIVSADTIGVPVGATGNVLEFPNSSDGYCVIGVYGKIQVADITELHIRMYIPDGLAFIHVDGGTMDWTMALSTTGQWATLTISKAKLVAWGVTVIEGIRIDRANAQGGTSLYVDSVKVSV